MNQEVLCDVQNVMQKFIDDLISVEITLNTDTTSKLVRKEFQATLFAV